MKMRITILILLPALLIGCGKKGGNIAEKAGESIGQKVTDFTKGVGKGIDAQMTVEVSLLPKVEELGLSKTIAKSLGLDATKKGFTVYFIASKDVSSPLLARALNAEGLEIGRCWKQVSLKKGDAAYV